MSIMNKYTLCTENNTWCILHFTNVKFGYC